MSASKMAVLPADTRLDIAAKSESILLENEQLFTLRYLGRKMFMWVARLNWDRGQEIIIW